mmetsp:Transcript_31121/g.92727  ORF Transcript_31121/g.92727 Transcript_31121/m.92727 type:complete len:237 (-) Transcript_31121:4046-4756(-)
MPSLAHRPPPNAQIMANTKYISNMLCSVLLLTFSGLRQPSRMLTSVVTKFMVLSGVMWLYAFFISRIVSGMYLSKNSVNHLHTTDGSFHLARSAYALTTRLVHETVMLRHCWPSEMYRMPARVAVAGVANLRSRISKMSFMCGSRRMRSLDGSVSRRLSSMTEFIDSIQLASRSPSSMIHLGLSSGMLASSRMLNDSRPSFHSRVAILTYPYSSCVEMDLGLMSRMTTFLRLTILR